MRRWLAWLAGLAALALASVVVQSITVPAQASGYVGQVFSVTTGTASTPFSIALTPPDNRCPGDTAGGGYRWHMFLLDAAVSTPDALVISNGAISLASGVPGPGKQPQPLFSTTGTPQLNRNTAIGTGQIVGTVQLSLQTNQISGNDTYWIGYFCTLGGVMAHFWASPLTITDWVDSNTYRWHVGLIPEAPGASVSEGDGEVYGTLTASAGADPAPSSYTITVTWIGGVPDPQGPITLVSPCACQWSVLGLVVGGQYLVQIRATNSVGTGPPLTTVVTATTTPVLPAAVVGIEYVTSPLPFEPPRIRVGVTRPTPPVNATLLSSSFIIAGNVYGLSPTQTTFDFIRTLSPCTAYRWTLLSSYNLPFSGGGASGTFVSPCLSSVVQDLQVVRPQGALVLTQRCGVYGTAPAAVDPLLGPLPLLEPTPGAVSFPGPPPAVGTAPTLGAGGPPDPAFSQYPYPVDAAGVPSPTYPTNCAIDLGTGRLLTAGPVAGQYFAVTGRIAQLTVVNTRDEASTWAVGGTMSDFVSTTDASDRFSGNLLGWYPMVTWDSPPDLDGSDMSVEPGLARIPVASDSTTGLGAPFDPGLGAISRSLAFSAAGGSLGMAVIDARINLLIPVTADAGTYRGSLVFTVI